jgi:uncharacterized OB-fold protein
MSGRMAPAVTDLNRAYWTGGSEGKLLIQRCAGCERWVHPPVDRCPACRSSELRAEPVSGRGTVFTFTVNRHPFNPAVPLPYVIALVQLEEQDDLRVTTNIVNCPVDDVTVGMPVQVLFEEQDGLYVPLFEPLSA